MPQLQVLKKARSFSELEGMFRFSDLKAVDFLHHEVQAGKNRN
jgi:hypothetical protein